MICCDNMTQTESLLYLAEKCLALLLLVQQEGGLAGRRLHASCCQRRSVAVFLLLQLLLLLYRLAFQAIQAFRKSGM